MGLPRPALNCRDHLFDHRPAGEVQHLARHILEFIIRQIDTFVDQQDQVVPPGGADFRQFAPQIVRVPEADDLHQRAPSILFDV